MKYTPIASDIQKKVENIVEKYYPLHSIIKALVAQGASVYMVGGAVRDLLLEREVKDLDVEVHNISLATLENVLSNFGTVNQVGKSFGVLRLPKIPIDWSIPRSDETGRKPKVTFDPHMDFASAARRRDLTMNSMAIDLQNFVLLDPFNGYADMQAKILRTPDPKTFVEDPLRFFRIMQFIGRFEMEPDDILNHICSTMDISNVSRERIEEEFKKLFLQSLKPSRGIRWLSAVSRLGEVLPELAATRGIEQNPKWHPEGDVFEHTMQTVDAAAVMHYSNDYEKLIGIYAAIGHDLGKVVTTTIVNGVIKSRGHERASVTLTRRLLKRITREKKLIDTVALLVRYHMEPGQFAEQHARAGAYKRLALKLAPLANLRQLAMLAIADKRGRNWQSSKPLTNDIAVIDTFVERAKELGVYEKPETPLLQGKDLLDLVPAGPELGKLVKKLYALQIAEGIKDKQALKKRARKLTGD